MTLEGTKEDTVQSTSSAAASFIETLNGKPNGGSLVSPRTEDSESIFLAPSGLEGNVHHNSSRGQRANSIVAGASPFASTSSLWTASLESLTVEPTALPMALESISASNLATTSNSSSTGTSLWETPRRASASSLSNNWKCVGSAASMLQDSTGRLDDILSEDSTELVPKTRSSSILLEKSVLSSNNVSSLTTEKQDSRTSSPSSHDHFMQIPALLHEEIGIENAEEAAEIFKRSSMDSLLDFDPTSLFASHPISNNAPSSDLKSSLLMSAVVSPTGSDFRRHSFNWLSNNKDVNDKQVSSSSAFVPSKTIVEVSSYGSSRAASPVYEESGNSSPIGSPILDTFHEEFIFAPSSVAQFSKKRFARRHSIAADGVAALEDSFAQTLSFGNPADVTEFFPSSHTSHYINNNNNNSHHQHHHNNFHGHHHQAPHQPQHNSQYYPLEEYPQPITGNIYAAYAGLLGENFDPEHGNASDCGGEMNTFLNSMRLAAGNSASSIPIMFNHQMPVSYTPAQAGVNPTVLSFPNATFHLASHKGPLYLIEFKSGRTELFFTVDLDTALRVKVDDLVIVEADRGEDFGRITGEISITKFRQLIAQVPHENNNSNNNNSNNNNSSNGFHSQSSHGHSDDVYGSNGNVNHNLAGMKESEIAALVSSKEIVPKRIHRHATAVDMKFLQAKAQEEAYAMSRCQSRIRQKKLPMEVVDAEYQW